MHYWLDLTMMKPLTTAIISLTLLVAACSNPNEELRNQYRWLSGKWVGKDGETTVIEEWKWNRFRFEGNGYRIDQGDTTTKEFLVISSFGAHNAYIITLNDKNTYAFQEVETVNKQVHFANPDHDFPAHISYTLQQDSILEIDLRGNTEGMEGVNYQLKRQRR